MRRYIYSVMKDGKDTLPAKMLKVILSAASGFYLIGVVLRKMLYALGIFRTHRVSAKVISVGNLTLGGTGKTPFAVMLAKLMKERMHKNPVVLIRGYGWDEQAMARDLLNGIPLIVGRDRVKSSSDAIAKEGADTIILDDGFQHRRMARDLDILLIDTRDPFGNNRLFPRGVLREPVAGLKRADVVVLTKSDKSLVDKEFIRARVRRMNENALFLESEHKAAYLWDLKTKERLALDGLKGKGVYLVSAIGDGAYFEETVKDLGAEIKGHSIYEDHHNYSSADIKDISGQSATGDLIVTTEKDAVKLSTIRYALSAIRWLALHVDMVITKGEEELVVRLNSLYIS